MRTLTLVGRGPSWKECPFNTDELWATTSCLDIEGMVDKPYTKLFAFDGIEQGQNPDLQEQLAIAKERNIPVVSTKEYATERFPLIDIAKQFGSSYFMPTFSYMIAYALYLNYERLFIYGIDQGPRWEYQAGKPHIVFWLGVATGRKVDLRIGNGSLRWAYRLGLNELPERFFESLDSSIANHIGLQIRQDELNELSEAQCH